MQDKKSSTVSGSPSSSPSSSSSSTITSSSAFHSTANVVINSIASIPNGNGLNDGGSHSSSPSIQTQTLHELNRQLARFECSAHLTDDGRIYYMNHETKTSSWLPPMDVWNAGDAKLPFGWEMALDKQTKHYFINHVNKTTTYESPKQEIPITHPEPRTVEITRDPVHGFGFVVGSEKPVLIRCVNEGPSANQLLPGDEILEVNGQNVRKANQEHVIQLIKSCTGTLTLTVCQPHTTNSARKSALLSAAKREQLKQRPGRVRFAENVSLSDNSPLYSQDGNDGQLQLANLPNILKVYLENGQTKTFKYDSSTTVQDVLDSLVEKLSIRRKRHFALCVEHTKWNRRNKLSILDPKETVSKIAAQPGAHNLRCVFRFSFFPRNCDCVQLLRQDPVAFHYLYSQSSADLLSDRLNGLLMAETTLRLAALRLQQQALTTAEFGGGSGTVNGHSEKNSGRHSISSRLKKRPALLGRSSSSGDAKDVVQDKNSTLSTLSGEKTTTSADSSGKIIDNNCNTTSVSLDQMLNCAKACVKQMERAYGLENFAPSALVHTMKKKELIKLLLHFYKQNQTQLLPTAVALLSASSVNGAVTAVSTTTSIDRRSSGDSGSIDSNSTTATTNTQVKLRSNELKRTFVSEQSVKLCFLNLLSEVEAFGAKVFNVRKVSLDYRPNTFLIEPTLNDKSDDSNGISGLSNYFANSLESVIWLSPKLGICHVTKNLLGHSLNPLSLAQIDQVSAIRVTRKDDCYYNVELDFKVNLSSDELGNALHFVMDEKMAEELIVCLNAFYALYVQGDDETQKEIPLFWDVTDSWWTDSAPNYYGQHLVKEAPWNYICALCTPSDFFAAKLNSLESQPIDQVIPIGFHQIDLTIPPPRYTPFDITQFTSLPSSHSVSSSLQSPFTSLPMFSSFLPGCANSTKLNSQLAAELARQLQLRRNSLDSDPDSISAGGSSTEAPPPGQLKATDSLLLLNQLEGTAPLSKVSASESDTDSNDISGQKVLYTRSLGTEADEEDEDEEEDEELDEEAAEREANQLVIEVSARELVVLAQSQLSVRESSCLRPASPVPNQVLQSKDLTQPRSRLSLDMEYLPTQPRMVRSESSFGLHSPADEIKALPNGETLDIIDLTAIPPPPEPGLIRNPNLFTSSQLPYTSSISGNTASGYETDNIDQFIASLSIPPPPTESHLNEQLDIRDLIVIPPPPSVQPYVQRQDELLNKFRKATEDMKRICKQPSDSNCGKTEHSDKESLKSLSVTNMMGKNSGRDLNSASSADSGYESVIVNHSIQVSSDSPSLISVATTSVSTNDFSPERFSICDDRRDYANVIRPLMAKPPKAPPRRVDSLHSNDQDDQPVFNLALNELRRLQEMIKLGSNVDQETKNANDFRQQLSILAQNSEQHWAESLSTLRTLQTEDSINGLNQLSSSSIVSIREALITSCRQFVTSSKLFVKSATEHTDPLLPDHLGACVLQLQRICQLVSLLNSFNSSSNALVQNLIRVLRTYAFTVQTVGQLRSQCFESVPQSPQLNLLMEHATELASALSVLMKCFRD